MLIIWNIETPYTTYASVEDVNKGGKSSYSGLMKAIKDFGGVNKKWIVNGHILKKEVILRAQQKAGVIHPGSYWLVSSMYSFSPLRCGDVNCFQ